MSNKIFDNDLVAKSKKQSKLQLWAWKGKTVNRNVVAKLTHKEYKDVLLNK